MKNIFLLIVLMVLLSSCEDFFSATKEVDLGEFSGQVTVVGRLINTDLDTIEDFNTVANLGVLVSRSRSVVDTTNFPLIKNANINLTGSDGLDVTLDYDTRSGYYLPRIGGGSEFMRISVNENTSYELIVDVPGEERILATCETKDFGEIKSIDIIQDDIEGDGNNILDRIQIEVDDPVGKNYYYVRVFYEYSDENGGKYLNGGYLYNYNSIFDDSPELFTDELFDGKNEVLEFWSERYVNSINGQIGPTEPNRALVFIWSLSEEEYEFRRSIDANNIAQDNPFAEPSIVFSNIENGIGVFSMSRVERFSVPWQ